MALEKVLSVTRWRGIAVLIGSNYENIVHLMCFALGCTSTGVNAELRTRLRHLLRTVGNVDLMLS